MVLRIHTGNRASHLYCATTVAVHPVQRTWRPHTRARAADTTAGDSTSSSQPSTSKTPWHFGAQTNERLLHWDENAQAQLLRIWLCNQLGIQQDQLDEKLAALANLLPDMVVKLHALRAPLVLELLQDMPGVASRLLRLRALLPGADVSAMVAQVPELLLKTPMPELEAAIASLGENLPGVSIGHLVEREPMLLRADVKQLLSEVGRLMPGKDPVAFLAANPGELIDMEVAGLPSTLEFN